ncbi:helix-turn-helix transcriptional regulator [Algoriphagus aestuariicola]|uniref:Helix-turn-helix transcriptional regulator n=1 Tax=Algoriphagus aestuariicola TaxID=1852016 RepID=A0ABS3BPV8_9BACT|nr:helix-turn-helix transcriptional regulator [Algoriphagus aestuariicola]MBN7801188.1 helix-turn-helix transcriptional regulator [Algoriphagus aestuariicola]
MEVSNERNSRVLSEKIGKFEELDRWLPGVKVIQRIEPAENLYLCQRGRDRYGLSQSFFKHLPMVEFRRQIFDAQDPHTCLIGTYSSHELYIRYSSADSPGEAELISVEIVKETEAGLGPLRVIQIFPSSLMGWVPAKTARIVSEMAFSKIHRRKFQQLTRRGREVLAFMVKGMSAEEIADRLFIGVNTVNTHKRRVREVLEIKSNYELLQYGLAFDLM